MQTRTKLCAVALVLAIAAPVAISQVSPEAAPAGRILPTTAATYADYQAKVSDIMTKELGGAADLEKAIDTFGAPNVGQLSAGWISYSGILAAQHPDFVKEVRNIDNYYGRERLMLGLERDLGYARTLKGGEQALQNVLAANTRDTSRLSSAGAFVKEQSYKLQKVGWGKERVKNPDAILKSMKTSTQASKPITDAVSKIFAGPDLDAMLSTIAVSPTTADSLWDKFSVVAVNAPGKALGTVSPVAVAQQDLARLEAAQHAALRDARLQLVRQRCEPAAAVQYVDLGGVGRHGCLGLEWTADGRQPVPRFIVTLAPPGIQP